MDVTNTTDRTCANIHPVVVLVDEARALKAAQPRLEFYAGRHPHPVRFETTDEDELVGAFEAGDFAGFTVGPGATTRVKVRLSVTSDAVANEVTASAAVVQRQDNDGDWVGQSNDYRFAVHGDPDTDTDTDSGTDSATEPPADQDPSAVPTPEPSDADGRVTLADELARTGLGSPRTALTVAGVLLVAGGTLLLARRRR
ncbi:LPXTG cell wall anchor domain-containing protein [Streptomyces sp. NPDC088387]|uniref:LPXTG cell wall anchor domain-containing protein n=1 Tax=Streptomyces sp. NPDC088387 TaxID=3365859 RepID=UPI00381290F2